MGEGKLILKRGYTRQGFGLQGRSKFGQQIYANTKHANRVYNCRQPQRNEATE